MNVFVHTKLRTKIFFLPFKERKNEIRYYKHPPHSSIFAKMKDIL